MNDRFTDLGLYEIGANLH